MSDVVYLYGFVPADAPAPPATLRGVEDRPVELLALGDVAAVIAHVPATEYQAERVNARMDDLGWLAERGIAHERVVAWLVDQGDVLPAGLLTLFSSVAALRADAGPRAPTLRAQLARLYGAREWDLKVAWERARLEAHAGAVSPEIRALDDEIAAAAPGRRFLLEKKRADLLRRELGQAARRAAGELFDRLREHARDAVTRAAPRADVELPVVLAAALLVERGREAALQDACAEERGALEPLGFTVELTGPWAPYRFLEPHPDVDAA